MPLAQALVKARYRATLVGLAQRYAEWETIGEAEVRVGYSPAK
jgi:hypothetical protein